MRPIAVVMTVGAVCVGTTGGALAPADGAGSPVRHLVVHHDPAQDVVYFPVDQTGRHRMPGARDPDITRVGVRYGEHNVWVRLTLRRLRQAAGPAADKATRNWRFRIATPKEQFKYLGEVHPEDEAVPLIRAGDCRRLRLWFFYARAVVVTMVPRKCIGEPRWVRVGVVFQRQPDGGLYDDAFSAAPAGENSWGTLSRRVHK